MVRRGHGDPGHPERQDPPHVAPAPPRRAQPEQRQRVEERLADVQRGHRRVAVAQVLEPVERPAEGKRLLGGVGEAVRDQTRRCHGIGPEDDQRDHMRGPEPVAHEGVVDSSPVPDQQQEADEQRHVGQRVVPGRDEPAAGDRVRDPLAPGLDVEPQVRLEPQHIMRVGDRGADGGGIRRNQRPDGLVQEVEDGAQQDLAVDRPLRTPGARAFPSYPVRHRGRNLAGPRGLPGRSTNRSRTRPARRDAPHMRLRPGPL